MKTTNIAATAAAMHLATLICSNAQSLNLLVNGNFEAGNTGFTSDYIYSPGDIVNPRTYDVVTNPRNSHPLAWSMTDHTSGSGYLLAANGSVDQARVVWRQSVSVQPGTVYAFSGWAASWNGTSPDPQPPVLSLLINGVSVGGLLPVPQEHGVWTNFIVSWSSGAATNATIEIRDDSVSWGDDLALDDLAFELRGFELTIRCSEVQVCWQTVSNILYQVEYRSDLTTNIWTALGAPILGTGTNQCIFDKILDEPRRFYRVQALP